MMALKKAEKVKSIYRAEQEIIGKDSSFAIIEAYKTIRTNLMFALPKHGCKKIILTSASPKEGKTCSAINLALTLALMNTRVLLIDCDLRRASIHRIMKLKGIPGLSEMLGGMEQLSDIIQSTMSPTLKVICAGTLPPNPAELLGSDEMGELLAELEPDYDYILMDTPPVNVVADALTLSKISDGVIMIARGGETTHKELSKALSSLKFADARLLGIIMNDMENGGSFGYKRYHYGS